MNIAEFAKAVGLSTATVSRAFHEPDKLKPETREHVLAMAATYNYYPNPSGRALVKGRHDALGLVWPLEVEGAAAPFALRIMAALTQQLVKNDLDLLICPVDRRQPATIEHARRTLLRSRCDAWILLYPRQGDVLTESLRRSQKPVICFMGQIPECPDWKCVQLNQRTWIEEALKRLRSNGAKRVLFLGCREGEPDHVERLSAFNELAPKYFGTGFESFPTWPPKVEEVGRLLSPGGIDAVIGVDDVTALAALQACQRWNIRVPERIQIIGIDDTPEAAGSVPRLTTFRQPLDGMAAAAVELALERRVNSKTFEPIFVGGATLR